MWFETRYGAGNHPAVVTAEYLTRKGWLAAIGAVHEILENPSLDINNTDMKLIRDELTKLKR